MHTVKNAASGKHLKMLQVFADFVGCNVEYRDRGNGEDVTLVRDDGEKLVLNVRGNRYDGGFLVLRKGDEQ